MPEYSATPKRSNIQTIVISAITLFAGIAFIAWKDTSSTIISYVLAGLLTLAGLIHVLSVQFRNKTFLPFPGIAAGLTVLSIGIYFLLKIEALKMILNFVLPIFVIYLGFIMVQATIDFKKAGAPRWWIAGILALITLLCGFFSLFDIFNDVNMIFLGISLCVVAVLEAASILLFKENGPVFTEPVAPATPAAPAAPAWSPAPAAPAATEAPIAPAPEATVAQPQEVPGEQPVE